MAVAPLAPVELPQTSFVRPFYAFFERAGTIVKAFIGFSDEGAEFVFGNLARPGDIAQSGSQVLFIFAFKRAADLFVSAFSRCFITSASAMDRARHGARGIYLMGTSARNAVGVGQRLHGATGRAHRQAVRADDDQLGAVRAMVSGMAHISGGMMVVHQLWRDPVAVLTTSVMACP